jgi:hypothetical protein
MASVSNYKEMNESLILEGGGGVEQEPHPKLSPVGNAYAAIPNVRYAPSTRNPCKVRP